MGDNFTIVVWIFITGSAVIQNCRSTEDTVAILNTIVVRVVITNAAVIPNAISVANACAIQGTRAVWVTVIGCVDICTDALGAIVTGVNCQIIGAVEKDIVLGIAAVAVCDTWRKASVAAHTLTAIIGECSTAWDLVTVNDAGFKASGSSHTNVTGVAKCSTT